MASPAPASNSGGLLVVYGVPPQVPIADSSGRDTGKKFSLAPQILASFEAALRRALVPFLGTHAAVQSARFVFIKNAGEFRSAVQSGSYSHVIYYGHAMEGMNTLLPTVGNSITSFQLANALKSTKVQDFDILGCSSMSIAAELSLILPAVRIGHLRAARMDNIEVNPQTMLVRGMSIDPQTVHHYGGQRK